MGPLRLLGDAVDGFAMVPLCGTENVWTGADPHRGCTRAHVSKYKLLRLDLLCVKGFAVSAHVRSLLVVMPIYYYALRAGTAAATWV